MPKRKHSEIEDKIDKIADSATRMTASRLQVKISYSIKSLKDALNLARGFERQKMGRRQKKASGEPHTLLRLREEVIILKELDLMKTARNYLLKQMVKTKRIRESAAFIALYGEDPKIEGPGGNAAANVLGRLFKARPVLDVVHGVMDEVRQILGLDTTKVSSRNGTNQPQKQNKSEQAHHVVEKEKADTTDDFEGFSDKASSAVMDDATASDDEISNAEVSAYNDMIAGSSDDSEDDAELELDPMEISDIESQDHDRDASLSLSPDDVSEDRKAPSQRSRPSSASKTVSTSFLPSLSMGGYYSGSESEEAEDLDSNLRGPARPKERKNRRGQRERQKLAELKFGQDAKHIQNQEKNGKDTRNSGWDAKRGAVASGKYDPREKRKAGGGGFTRSKGPTGANGEVVVGMRSTKSARPAAKKQEGPLHPSWEAAKKRKQETGKAAFAGKKITFD